MQTRNNTKQGRRLRLSTLALLAGALATSASQASSITVQTIAAMQALGASSAATGNVHVMSYAGANDGGGGWFIWDNASTATTNVCTVFQATGVTTGRWMRQLSGDLNVDMCGADQVSDSSAAINAAFGLCSANSGIPVALSAKYYQVRHNLASDPACAVHGAPSAGVGGVDTYLDFTNDTDGGPCWSIVGTAGFGNFSGGNSVSDFVMLGNAAGNASLAHCSQGLYVSRAGNERLHDVAIISIDGPCLFWGSTIVSSIDRVSVANCGSATTGMVEIDGETSAGADVGGTTLTINRLNASNGTATAQAGVKIDRYGIVNWLGGTSENAGIPVMVATKAASTVGVGILTMDSIDLENPNNGATGFIEAGTNWSGTPGRAVVDMTMRNNTLVADNATIASGVIVKDSMNFYAQQNDIQIPNSGSVVFDFQGANNLHENVFLTDTWQITPSFTYVKVNGNAIADAVAATPWSVDNAVQPSTYFANTAASGTVTLTPGVDSAVQTFTTTLSGNVTVTLSTTHASSGFRWRVSAPAVLAGHTFTVNGLALAAHQWVEFSWDGSAYQETAAGTLL